MADQVKAGKRVKPGFPVHKHESTVMEKLVYQKYQNPPSYHLSLWIYYIF